VLLLVIAGFISTGVNLVFYFNDIWHEIRVAGKCEAGKGWQLIAVLSLIGNCIVLIMFVGLIAATLWNVAHISENKGWLPDLLQVGRLVAVTVFSCFFIGDLALYRAQAARSKTLTEAKNIEQHQNNMSLSRLSVGLIDAPALILAGLVLYVIALLKNHAAFHQYRSMMWPYHVVMRPIDSDTFELALYGVEAGVLAATLIVSQLIFAVLMARWQIADSRIDAKYRPEGGPKKSRWNWRFILMSIRWYTTDGNASGSGGQIVEADTGNHPPSDTAG
jgi:hypothetical protein